MSLFPYNILTNELDTFTSADLIAQMGSTERTLYGPPPFSWASQAFFARGRVAHGSSCPSAFLTGMTSLDNSGVPLCKNMYWNAFMPWIVAIAESDNTCTNAYIKISKIRCYILSNRTGLWTRFGSQGNGYPSDGLTKYKYDYSTSYGGATVIYDVDGAPCFYPWHTVGPEQIMLHSSIMVKGAIDGEDYGGCFVVCESQLVAPIGADFDATPRYALQLGADLYPDMDTSLNAGVIAGQTYIPGVGASAFRSIPTDGTPMLHYFITTNNASITTTNGTSDYQIANGAASMYMSNAELAANMPVLTPNLNIAQTAALPATVAIDISLAGGTTQSREGSAVLSIDFTTGTPTEVTLTRNDNHAFAVWPSGALSQYFTSVTGGLEFDLSLAHMNLGLNAVSARAIYADDQSTTARLIITIEEVVEVDPEEISVAMLGGLTQYQTGIDTLQITFDNGTPVAVNVARNAETTFAQWPTGNLSIYFTEVPGGLEFDLSLAHLNIGENSIGVTATYSDASTAEAFLTLHISEVPAEEPPPDPTPPSPLPAFPGAEGFGAASVGGRGGTVLFVTNLNDSGAGSLRAALMAEYPRTVVFRVGGTIDLLSDISISGASRSYLTVAGQTAPGGIQTRYKTIEMSNGIHDVIFRFVRHRRGWEDYTPGEAESNNHGPGLTIYSYGDPCYNIIIDHCSFAWQQDDNSFWQSVHDVTWQWCILAEAKNTLVDGDPEKGINGKGLISGTEDGDGALMYNVSLHHNFIAHNYQRSPLVKGAGPFEIVNNLVYNWAAFGTSIDYTNAAGSKVNLIGNYYKEGPDAFDRYAVTINDATHPADMIYVSDNISPQRTSGAQDEWDVVGVCDGSPYCNTPASTSYQKDTAWAASDYPITIADAIDVPALVLAGVGATLPARDATDTRIVSEYYLGTGSIHTYNSWPTITGTTAPTDADNDGMADSWETSEAVTDPSGVAANGYTNLENYINSLV